MEHFKVSSQNLFGEKVENHEKPVTIPGLQSTNWMWHLWLSSKSANHYTMMLHWLNILF